MANEVVDIRKRIEEMRNEVSAAIVSNRDLSEASRSIGDKADIAITHSDVGTDNKTDREAQQSKSSLEDTSSTVSDETVKAYKSLEMASKMPTFNLNVRNQVSNRFLFFMIGIQVVTNLLLILVIWTRLG
ncbi:hypothetical protein N8500_04750 [Candidatus Puniceispirillum sp.]|nr:hypothetical protein [Candidatus Puniceispirillum sp.]